MDVDYGEDLVSFEEGLDVRAKTDLFGEGIKEERVEIERNHRFIKKIGHNFYQ